MGIVRHSRTVPSQPGIDREQLFIAKPRIGVEGVLRGCAATNFAWANVCIWLWWCLQCKESQMVAGRSFRRA